VERFAEEPELAQLDPADGDPPQREPPVGRGLSEARLALIAAHAAINPDLRDELRHVGLRLPDDINPYVALGVAATAGEAEDRPAVHPLQLAFATMAVLRERPVQASEYRDELRAVARTMADPEQVSVQTLDDIIDALVRATQPDVSERDRWSTVMTAMGNRLHPDMSKIKEAWCVSGFRGYDGEIVSRVETRLVVQEPKDLDELARAVIPDNWSRCNDFFCSLVPRPGRDATCPHATGGRLLTTLTNWRGVYEERVGSCPDGWFPDTFLIFTWTRSPRQIILQYELAPRQANDRTVLRIDQGYLQVDRIGDTYEVATLKYLLFDDEFIPGGGQTLGASACLLGWLDYSINQFTACTRKLPAAVAGAVEPEAGIDADLQKILERCKAHVIQSVSETDAQFRRTVRRIRHGRYGPDDTVAEAAQIVVRAIRDGSRSLTGQMDLAVRYADLVDERIRRRADGS
jgi:hypothetical protein